jgi:hypothetical protein
METAGIVFFGYVTTDLILWPLLGALELYPAFAVALVTVFFWGFRLLPVVSAAAVVSAYAIPTPPLALTIPLAAILQAARGAHLLKHWAVDPIFRHDRDVFYLLASLGAISFIFPTLEALRHFLFSAQYGFEALVQNYISTFFVLVVTTPFMLRWIAKPRFKRTRIEVVEIATIFGPLVLIATLLFFLSNRDRRLDPADVCLNFSSVRHRTSSASTFCDASIIHRVGNCDRRVHSIGTDRTVSRIVPAGAIPLHPRHRVPHHHLA